MAITVDNGGGKLAANGTNATTAGQKPAAPAQSISANAPTTADIRNLTDIGCRPVPAPRLPKAPPLQIDTSTLSPADKLLYDQNPVRFTELKRMEIATAVKAAASAAELATDGMFMTKDGKGNVKLLPPTTPFSAIKGIFPDACGTKPVPGLKVIQVTGIATPAAEQLRTSQYLANLTGAEVIAIRNATGGALTDIIQSARDKTPFSDNKAVETLKTSILSELKAGKQVNLLLHSQGAIIGSAALTRVRDYLTGTMKMTLAQAEAKMSAIRVYTIGGASGRFVDGPQYTHDINVNDLVPGKLGLGALYNSLPLLTTFVPGSPKAQTVVFYGELTPGAQPSAPKVYKIDYAVAGKGATINFFLDKKPNPLDKKLPVYGGHHFDIYMRHFNAAFFVPSK